MPALDYPGAAKRAEVTADFASGALSISIDAATNWPDGAGGKFVVVVDPLETTAEKILIASRTGTILTVDGAGRGYDGTSAASHTTGAVIYPVFDAESAQRHEDHIFDTSDAHDASAISYAGAAGMTATDVEGAIDELAADVAAIPTTAFVGARAFRSGALNIPNNVATAIALDGESYDSATLHSTGVNPSRITVPVDGKYLAIARARFSTSAAGNYRTVELWKNGAAVAGNWQQNPGAIPQPSVGVQDVISCTAGDYIEMAAFQDSGGDLALLVGTALVYLSVVKVG